MHIFGLCDTEVPEFSQSRVISEMSFVPAGVPCLPRSLISTNPIEGTLDFSSGWERSAGSFQAG